MATVIAPLNEIEILSGVMGTDDREMDPETARVVLRWKFPERDVKAMNKLARRNSQGKLTAAEQEQLDRYLRVGYFINILQAKARVAIKKAEELGA